VAAVTFWPVGIDPREQVFGFLRLASIDAPSGLARFMIGQDGVFTDTTGNAWVGSQLIEASELELPRDATAPEGQLTLSYFQDPDAPDLIDQLRASGDAAIRGSVVRFYIQPITSHEEFYRPTRPPILRAVRVATSLTFSAQGDTVRQISLRIEGPFAARQQRRGWVYSVNDHSALVGAANPSLQYMPQISQQLEKLYG
jgi:hypothetical protein